MTDLRRQYLSTLFAFASHCIPKFAVVQELVILLLDHACFKYNCRMEASRTNSMILTKATAFSVEIEAVLQACCFRQ